MATTGGAMIGTCDSAGGERGASNPSVVSPSLTSTAGSGRGRAAAMSLVRMLRRETAADHDAVDARYGGFRLDDRGDYARLLLAHGRSLPTVEAALAVDPALPAWRGRTGLLAADLVELGVSMPEPLSFRADGPERWGALYVVEGSRLGGAVLARSVPAGWPAAYLGARHLPGEWRHLLAAIDARGEAADPAWRARAVEGARATFALYRRAAE